MENATESQDETSFNKRIGNALKQNNNRVYTLGDSVIKHVKCSDISRFLENCKTFVKGFTGARFSSIHGNVQPKIQIISSYMLVQMIWQQIYQLKNSRIRC